MITYSGLRLYFFSFSSKWERSLRSAPMIQKRSELRLWASEQSESEAHIMRHFGNASTVTGGSLLPDITSFCLLPNVKESVECVSIRGLESGGFVLFKRGKNGSAISEADRLVRSKSQCTFNYRIYTFVSILTLFLY